MPIHAFIVLIMLVVTWKIISPMYYSSVRIDNELGQLVWGSLGFAWMCVFAFEAFKFVHWFLVAPDHQIVFVAGAFFITRWVLKTFGKLLPRYKGFHPELIHTPLDPVLQRNVFIYGLATIFWWGSLVYAVYRFVH